jgi:hypothetical protein
MAQVVEHLPKQAQGPEFKPQYCKATTTKLTHQLYEVLSNPFQR